MMRVKTENEKAGFKLNIPKTMTMASGPFISWQIDGGKVETVGSDHEHLIAKFRLKLQ